MYNDTKYVCSTCGGALAHDSLPSGDKDHEFDGVKFTGKITGYKQVLSFLNEIDEFDVSKKAWASIESAKEYLRGVE